MQLLKYCSPARLFPQRTIPLVFLSRRLQTEGRKKASSCSGSLFFDNKYPINHSFRLISPAEAFWVSRPAGLFRIRQSASSYRMLIPRRLLYAFSYSSSADECRLTSLSLVSPPSFRPAESRRSESISSTLPENFA